jgi:hypothetical protein
MTDPAVWCMIPRRSYNTVCVEVTDIVNSHEILAVLLVWEGNVASGFDCQGIMHYWFISESAVVKKERHKR